MSFYFAYGSNMDEQQMKERCPSAVLIGPSTLADYRLAFTIFSPKRLCGCADIVANKGETVYGLLYELSRADVDALDAFEGHPTHYQRVSLKVKNSSGEIEAYSYEVVNKQGDLTPSSHYLGLMQSAADLHTFPDEYRAFLRGIQTLP